MFSPRKRFTYLGLKSCFWTYLYYIYLENLKGKKGQTPLHVAALNGHTAICQLFLDNNQNKNPKDFSGWTPLRYAASKGHISITEMIFLTIK